MASEEQTTGNMTDMPDSPTINALQQHLKEWYGNTVKLAFDNMRNMTMSGSSKAPEDRSHPPIKPQPPSETEQPSESQTGEEVSEEFVIEEETDTEVVEEKEPPPKPSI